MAQPTNIEMIRSSLEYLDKQLTASLRAIKNLQTLINAEGLDTPKESPSPTAVDTIKQPPVVLRELGERAPRLPLVKGELEEKGPRTDPTPHPAQSDASDDTLPISECLESARQIIHVKANGKVVYEEAKRSIEEIRKSMEDIEGAQREVEHLRALSKNLIKTYFSNDLISDGIGGIRHCEKVQLHSLDLMQAPPYVRHSYQEGFYINRLNRTLQFNLHLSDEERLVIDDLAGNPIFTYTVNYNESYKTETLCVDRLIELQTKIEDALRRIQDSL